MHPACKGLFLLDSRVALGVVAKGRSAAPALNAVVKRALPTLLVQDFYPGYDYLPTRLNPADHPSRKRVLPAQVSGDPEWLLALRQGNSQPFLWLAGLPRQSRKYTHWAKMVVLLYLNLRIAPKDDIFDSTLGYPGEGPRLLLASICIRSGAVSLLQRCLTSTVSFRFLCWCCRVRATYSAVSVMTYCFLAAHSPSGRALPSVGYADDGSGADLHSQHVA